MKNLLNRSYALLIAIALVFVYAYYKFKTIDIVRDFTPNLLSEIGGILLTVFLIDRVIRKYQDVETNKYKAIALRQLRAPLNRIYHLFGQMYKASTLALPEPSTRDFSGLFTDNFYNSIGFIDLSKPAPIMPEVNWIRYLDHHFTALKSDIDNIVEKFGVYLGADTVDLMMKIKDSRFVLLATQFKVIPELHKTLGVKYRYNLLQGPDMAKILRDFVDNYIILVQYYNGTVLERDRIRYDESLWNENLMPKLGSDRIDST